MIDKVRHFHLYTNLLPLGMVWLFFLLHFALFAFFHSLLASEPFKVAVFSRFPALKRVYRLLFNLIAVVWTPLLVFSVPKTGLLLWKIPWPWTLVPFVLMLWSAVEALRAVFTLNAGEFLGLAQLKRKNLDDLDAATHAKLSTGGWYGRVRHPLYFFSMVFLISKPSMSVEHAVLTLLAGVYFYIGALREEKRLASQFGSAFSEWKSEVPMFIPFTKLRT